MDAFGDLRRQKLAVAFVATFLCTTIILFSCHSKSRWVEVDPGFSKYVDAYTSGIISKTASIKIQLSADVPTAHTKGDVVNESLFEISPSVKGKATWKDAVTIEFKPEEDLTPGQLYEVAFKLGDVTNVPAAFKDFRFNVQTLKPSFKVNQSGLRSSGERKTMSLAGEVACADFEKASTVEKLLTASIENQSLKLSWQHIAGERIYNFKVEGIERKATADSLVLSWNGEPLGIKESGQTAIIVPAIGDFRVLNITEVNEAEQYASIQFSDPLALGQELTGLVTISNQSDITYSINGSEVKIYTEDKLDGNYHVNVNPGIRNSWSDTLKQGFEANVLFEDRLPAVKMEGRGNIIPNSGKLLLPFTAVNLNAVDVSIIKIFESNIPQFLQNNSMDGDENLRRVARPVVEKTIRLDDDKSLDLHKRQRFSLDIDKYLKTEPGAIYHITLGFRPGYSLFNCSTSVIAANTDGDDASGDGDENDEHSGPAPDDQDAFWSRYDNYYPYGYNWKETDNPCSRSYYNKDRWAMRNVLTSNIGLTAKRGNNNSLIVAVSNILTTAPMEDVDCQVLDYQQQIIAEAKSGSDGFVNFDCGRKPYLLIAKKGSEKGYLKLDDGSSLPLGRFDVSGAEIKNGIKGFIFGERGVWRPGDSMYINCMIEDRDNKLPPDHPVEFNLISPQGQLYKRIVQVNGAGGFNIFRTATEQGSPTGNWLAKVKVGGAVFEKTLKIETIMPNRLKIDLNFGADTMLQKGAPNTGMLSAKWLFGATAKNLKATIEASIYARKTVFPNYAGYFFDNPTSHYSGQSKTVFDGTLDANGNTAVKPHFEISDNAPGMLSATMIAKVFEPGGGYSIDAMTMAYSPYSSYAGIKLPEGDKTWGYLLTNQTHAARIVNVDAKGRRVKGNSDVEIQFYKIQWRWWWDNSGESLSNFTQDRYNKLVKTETVHLTDGEGRWNFRVQDWGRYLVLAKDIRSGHVTGEVVYMDDPGWQSRENTDDPTAASMLSFTADKSKFNVGDQVTLTIPSSKNGRGLVSIESGSKVLHTFWVETQQGQTVVKFQATKEMSPNVFVNVSLLQPHAQTLNDLPIRMYGVLPVFVEDKNTVLKPVLSIPDVLRPGERSSLHVSEESGREMTYCVTLVDDGLLDLTKFKTPDPHGAFYAREALGVKSWDLYDYVIGAWAGGLAQTLTLGGDQDAGPLNQKHANRFKPVVLYMGPFHLRKGEKQTLNFVLPQYIGSVRAMVIACDHDSYGNAEKEALVKKPLMMLATMPRVLGPGETIKLPVTIFATDNNIRDVKVALRSNPLLDIVGETSQTISFSSAGEQTIYFNVKAKTVVGIAKVKLSATDGRETAASDIELDVRNPNPPVTSVSDKVLSSNEQWKTTIAAIGNASTAKGVMELSSAPPINLEKRLDYLIEYPYGCIEQTTSSVFPQLVLNQLMDLDDFRRAEIDKNIKAGIDRIQDFQRNDGGFSYWPGEPESDEWGTNYAGNFLIEAQTRGYLVNESLLQQWKVFERNRANSWAPSPKNFYGADLTQAYRLYLLALAKVPELGAMNRLKEFSYISAEAKWRLAAAYQLVGLESIAASLIKGLPVDFPERTNPGTTFGSDLRDESMVLETLTIMGKRDIAQKLLGVVAASLSSESWYSTQTTAYSLIAIAKFCGKNQSGAKIIANEVVNGKNVAINVSSYFSQTPVDLTNGSANIVVSNKGRNMLYVRLITRGQPLANDNLKVTNNSEILQMTVSYIGQDGKAMDVTRLAQGTDFIAKVSITNPGNHGYYKQMALSQIFPSGWEILNTRMIDGDNEGGFKSSPYTYQDIRDDRVYTYFNLAERQTLTYYVQLNASYPGRFFLPGTFCGAMYDNTIDAGVNGKWITVVNQ